MSTSFFGGHVFIKASLKNLIRFSRIFSTLWIFILIDLFLTRLLLSISRALVLTQIKIQRPMVMKKIPMGIGEINNKNPNISNVTAIAEAMKLNTLNPNNLQLLKFSRQLLSLR